MSTVTVHVDPLRIAGQLEYRARLVAVSGDHALAGLMLSAAETLKALTTKPAQEQPATNGAAPVAAAEEAQHA